MHKKGWNYHSLRYINHDKHGEDSAKDALVMDDVKLEFKERKRMKFKYGGEKEDEPR